MLGQDKKLLVQKEDFHFKTEMKMFNISFGVRVRDTIASTEFSSTAQCTLAVQLHTGVSKMEHAVRRRMTNCSSAKTEFVN